MAHSGFEALQKIPSESLADAGTLPSEVPPPKPTVSARQAAPRVRYSRTTPDLGTQQQLGVSTHHSKPQTRTSIASHNGIPQSRTSIASSPSQRKSTKDNLSGNRTSKQMGLMRLAQAMDLNLDDLTQSMDSSASGSEQSFRSARMSQLSELGSSRSGNFQQESAGRVSFGGGPPERTSTYQNMQLPALRESTEYSHAASASMRNLQARARQSSHQAWGAGSGNDDSGSTVRETRQSQVSVAPGILNRVSNARQTIASMFSTNTKTRKSKKSMRFRTSKNSEYELEQTSSVLNSRKSRLSNWGKVVSAARKSALGSIFNLFINPTDRPSGAESIESRSRYSLTSKSSLGSRTTSGTTASLSFKMKTFVRTASEFFMQSIGLKTASNKKESVNLGTLGLEPKGAALGVSGSDSMVFASQSPSFASQSHSTASHSTGIASHSTGTHSTVDNSWSGNPDKTKQRNEELRRAAELFHETQWEAEQRKNMSKGLIRSSEMQASRGLGHRSIRESLTSSTSSTASMDLERAASEHHSRKSRVAGVVRTQYFETCMGVIILLNTIMIGMEAGCAKKNKEIREGLRNPDNNAGCPTTDAFAALEHAFLSIYLAEILLRSFLLGIRKLLRSTWGRFDAFLVFTGIMTTWIMVPILGTTENMSGSSFLSIAKVLRLVRMVRALRLFVQFRHAWMLVRGLYSSALVMIWAFIMIVFLLAFFAVLGVDFIGSNSKLLDHVDTAEYAAEFVTIDSALLALSSFWLLDGCGIIYAPLVKAEPALCIYFLLVVMVLGVCCMNLVTAILVQNSIDSTAEDKDAQKLWETQRKKHIVPRLIALFNQLDVDGSGDLSKDELLQASSDVKTALSKASNFNDILQLFEALDVDGSGYVEIDEFCLGIFALAEKPDKPIEFLRISKRMMRFMDLLATVEALFEKQELKNLGFLTGGDAGSSNSVHNYSGKVGTICMTNVDSFASTTPNSKAAGFQTGVAFSSHDSLQVKSCGSFRNMKSVQVDGSLKDTATEVVTEPKKKEPIARASSESWAGTDDVSQIALGAVHNMLERAEQLENSINDRMTYVEKRIAHLYAALPKRVVKNLAARGSVTTLFQAQNAESQIREDKSTDKPAQDGASAPQPNYMMVQVFCNPRWSVDSVEADTVEEGTFEADPESALPLPGFFAGDHAEGADRTAFDEAEKSIEILPHGRNRSTKTCEHRDTQGTIEEGSCREEEDDDFIIPGNFNPSISEESNGMDESPEAGVKSDSLKSDSLQSESDHETPGKKEVIV
eukprot:gnl/MRDRNA2_/MRDRNA2_61410_c0_seq1.p1 gnl/MRDRNA2_/MRDRNA2_61410_c0~~gnl/MRDRNA2_/MRDRNA2_61410_c0_seq1.p1  ORF type:complete len:1271 (-),score=190.38 gnl/MRDRNA2_/MRDRNA2_61410_c0_seq1:214-4026(-)